MQVPDKISFQHDGFVARFGEDRGSPVALAGVSATLGAVILLGVLSGKWSLVAAFAGVGFGLTMLALRQVRAVVLRGSNEQLRIQRTGAAPFSIEVDGLRVEVVVKNSRRGRLQSLILTNRVGRWTLPANGWSSEELQALALLLRRLRPGAGVLPEPPPELARLLGAPDRTREQAASSHYRGP